MEYLLVPDIAIQNIACKKALVLAPHPDDEVFGCGGAIMRHVEQQIPVQVIIVTSGAYNVSKENEYSYIYQRQQESIAASSILGYGTPTFWRYQDRELFYGEKLIADIICSINDAGVDLVYAPSVYEVHPDHRALAMATIEAIRRVSHPVQLACYEIGLPIRPNLLLDISDLTTRKAQAMRCFTSQNAKQRYDLDIAALNRYRTYTLPAEVTAAEAYILTNSAELKNDPFKLYQSEHARQQKLGLTLDTKDTPLVSVIIRSLDRHTLSDALDSVALQTYANIEVIVVNAKGHPHRTLDQWCGRFPLRMTSNAEPLHRCNAANIGLQAATGFYTIFLDDDDLFLPEHITQLVTALQQNKNFRGAYAGVRVDHYIDNKLETSSVFNEPFDKRRLRGRNFIPIHAVLFERSLVADGCRFDDQLDVFEDWDFWFQILQFTELVHVDKISAVYRNAGGSGLGLRQNKNSLRALRGKVYNKWKNQLSGEQIDDLIEYREEVISNLHHDVIETRNQLDDTNNQLQTTHSQLDELNDQLVSSKNQIDTLLNHHNLLTQEVVTVNAKEAVSQKTIAALTQSTSWRVTAPLRFVSRIIRGRYPEALSSLRRRTTPFLKAVYKRLPKKYRNKILTTAYRFVGPFFSGMAHYEAWRFNSKNSGNHSSTSTSNLLTNMVDLPGFSPLPQKPGSIAIHVHLFYPDLTPEIATYLRNMPYTYDLFISAPNEEASKTCKHVFSELPQMEKLTISITPNRGRDIAPIFCTFGDALKEYDYIAHVHSKKSLYNNGATDGWRQYLLTNLLGSEQIIRKIFTLLTHENNTGLVYPQNFQKLPYIANTWLSNQANGIAWCNKLGISIIPKGYFDFPAGTMFWARAKALHPLFEAGIKIEDFEEETGQIDETLAHCLERLLGLVTKKSGFNTAILRDIQSNSWSRWRFEQYLSYTQENIHAQLSDPSVKIIIFDIFDTLLTRPLLNPSTIKSIVAHRAGEELGRIYLDYRSQAEEQARQKAGRDIDLNNIFEEFTSLSGLSSESIKRLHDLEEEIEIESVSKRTEAIELLQYAFAQNKKILLASDMFLSKSTIEIILNKHKITTWHELYVSSDVGLRKDSGELYQHILSKEQASPNEIIMIGDNEHSDAQIPDNLGIKYIHIMRPVELARGTPRMESLIEEQSTKKHNINQQLTLGMIVQRNFQPVYFQNFNATELIPTSPWAIGFSIAGPLILAFIQWLINQAKADDIKHLYFLAREGQIFKKAYDRWVENDAHAIASSYLILSRRTVSVPAISTFDDILKIARTDYHATALSTFIYERYGLLLSQNDCDELEKQEIWPKNKQVEIQQHEIDHIIPVLQALKEKIFAHAQNERSGLLAYLNDLDLMKEDNSSAVVDIGYAATIQGYLNHFTNCVIHGYYFITTERAQNVASKYRVMTKGCFGHDLDLSKKIPILLEEALSLEKLFSANDAQVIHYELKGDETAQPVFRETSASEHQSTTTRSEIQRGIIDFVDQSIHIRDNLIDDFTIPTELANDIFERFITNPSSSEKEILSNLVLDDYYCGLGLVN